ncbi:lysyl-tRNA synthetase [Cokeromyces recurvatus]|uniref:lysyl-tRNA synthetase n=1 Tax=Cokeromyces recurvatus TaxID=90255 RepID=UPI0022204E06|nr:lysyl-tRNA synthetase [Cokeromyces recurvatus]KAI7900281.1 lysyl-tRNA synthetase [Cokeromyces recurvatus]
MSKQQLLFKLFRPYNFTSFKQIPRRSFTSFRQERVLDYPRFTIDPNTNGRWITPKDLQHYQYLEKGQKAENELVTLTGRIAVKRESSTKLIFYDIIQNGETIQVVASKNRFPGHLNDFIIKNNALSRGDIVSFTGVPGKTNHGQLSLFVTQEMKVLTPCLRNIPRNGIKDQEKRLRERYLDLLVNPEASRVLRTRSKIIQFIRHFLDSRGFLEVETPILSGKSGGANARPFETHSHAFNMDMQLRIAPELYLKQLVIGGFDRVYEIGKQFRNEGIDADHNPEFTTCEFYQAYGNLESLMHDTETLLSEMATAICGDSSIQSKSGEIIDFKKPFHRINVMDRLENELGVSLTFLEQSDAVDKLVSLCETKKIKLSGPLTQPRILDKMISKFIEPHCVQPTFLYNHPLALSPLAKDAIDKKGRTVAARFELFVAGKELVNAYEELNDPQEQRKRFKLRLQDRDTGDLEAPLPDTDFCDALEYALPPTAGWGMGIDRVVQLMTGMTHIREVLTFPIMRSITVNSNREVEKKGKEAI